MLVSGTDHRGRRFEESTRSKNLCRGGAAFPILHEIGVGDQVDITITLARQGRRGETDFATRGRVVHVAAADETRETFVGVQFIGPRFHRVFLPESSA